MIIQCILSATIRRYADTGQTRACVVWLATSGQQGETGGPYPNSIHMQQLLLRALREGVNIVREEF